MLNLLVNRQQEEFVVCSSLDFAHHLLDLLALILLLLDLLLFFGGSGFLTGAGAGAVLTGIFSSTVHSSTSSQVRSSGIWWMLLTTLNTNL